MLGLCDSRDQTQGLRNAGQSNYKLAMLPAQHVCFQTKANLLNKCHLRLTPKAFNNSLIPKHSPYSSSITPRQCVAKANMLLFPFHLPCSISILPDTRFRLSYAFWICLCFLLVPLLVHPRLHLLQRGA